MRYLPLLLLLSLPVFAHNISGSNAQYLEALNGPAVGPFLYLGAKHMVTGTDHLLYLLAVVFFLPGLRQVFLFVSLFAVGHSITLIAGVLLQLMVNPWLIDAVIGLSVVYKAFENLGGFAGRSPDPRIMVFGFGLCHGLGLASKLQGFTLAEEGLVTNLVSFNVGVELGQILALVFAVLLLQAWQRRENFQTEALYTNSLMLGAGFLLAGYQLSGFWWAGGV